MSDTPTRLAGGCLSVFARLVAIVVGFACSAAALAAGDVAELTRGVTSIATAGVPGPIAVFGAGAFPVIAGRQDDGTLLPVVAAAAWGKGRVVAFGHGGMIGRDALQHKGTAAFVENCVRWLTQERLGPVCVVENEAALRLISAAGITAVAAGPGWRQSLAGYSVVVIDSHRIQDEDRPALAAFVTDGGGLLTGGLGWGWLQLHSGATIHAHPGNLLLRDAGMCWCDGTVDPTGNKAFDVVTLPASLHAGTAMDALEKADATGSGFDAQASASLIAAMGVAPMDHPLMARAKAVLAARHEALVPSADAPIRQDASVARAMLALEVELERRAAPEDVGAHAAAATFPGAVPEGAPRASRSVEVDLSVPGWHSTGLYAPPGGVVTITAGGKYEGCSVRIGCHTDLLWQLKSWSRVPDISRVWSIGSSPTRVASAFGGLVYVEVSRASRGTATFTVAGAVESPRFVLGKTTQAEWEVSRLAPAPWGELESGKVILSVPSASLRNLGNPGELMAFWDQISDAHATLATIPLQPPRPHRFVADVQISAGYMHSGYPIMTHLDAASQMTELDRLRKGSWGLLHELGHNHQEDDWTFEGTGEVTCNLFALHAIDTICTPDKGGRGHPGVDAPPSLQKYIAGGARFERWKSDPFLALHMYVQLEDAFGWGTFQQVFAEYRSLKASERPKTDAEKRDQWMVRFSRACGKNLGPFFQAWGVPTSDAARKSISDMPEWMPQEWPGK